MKTKNNQKIYICEVRDYAGLDGCDKITVISRKSCRSYESANRSISAMRSDYTYPLDTYSEAELINLSDNGHSVEDAPIQLQKKLEKTSYYTKEIKKII